MRIRVDQLRQRSDKAWSDKRRWYSTLYDCFRYGAPGMNPYSEGGNAAAYADLGGGGPMQHSPDLGEDVYDSTLAADALRLATRLSHEAFPPGQSWAELGEGPDFASEEDSATKRRGLIANLQEQIFDTINSSGFYLSVYQMVLDGILAGTGVMRVGASPDPSRLISFDPVPQHTVALEGGPRGEVWGFYRKLWLKAEEILSLWPAAKWRPDVPAESEPHFRYTVLECTYFHPETGIWYYDVVVSPGAGEDKRVVEEDLLVCPWVCWRYQLLPGEVQGRSPVMMALPDARTLNEAIRIQLEAASVRASGIMMYKNDGSFNPNMVTWQSGEFVAVGSTDQGTPTIRPIDLPGDVNLNQLVIQDLREAIHRTMLANVLPPMAGPVRSATEIVERTREAMVALGGPFLRITEEAARPLLRAVAYSLARAGKLKDLAAVSPTDAETGNPVPLMLDGTDIQVRFTSPLAQAQRLTDAETIVSWLQMLQGSVGPQAMQAGVKVEDVPEVLGKKLAIPAELVREADERSGMLQQAQAGGVQAPPGGMPGGPAP